MTEQDRIKAERAQLRAEFGALFDEASSILFELDPVGINYETNTDSRRCEFVRVSARCAELGVPIGVPKRKGPLRRATVENEKLLTRKRLTICAAGESNPEPTDEEFKNANNGHRLRCGISLMATTGLKQHAINIICLDIICYSIFNCNHGDRARATGTGIQEIRPMASESSYGLGDSIGYRLTQLSGDIKAEMRRRVSKYDVTTQQGAALMVLYRERRLNVTGLAERIDVDFGGTSRLVDRLEAKGLLSCHADGTDRRARRLELSRQGREVARKALTASKATNDVFFARISAKEARQFRAILEKLLGADLSRAAPSVVDTRS